MTSDKDNAPFAYDGLDRVIHEKARLGILTSLIAHPKGLPFSDLRQLCGLTDGNLSRHLQVLEEAEVVAITKSFQGKRPLTTCGLTAAGRRRFLTYIEVLERVVRDAARATEVRDAARATEVRDAARAEDDAPAGLHPRPV